MESKSFEDIYKSKCGDDKLHRFRIVKSLYDISTLAINPLVIGVTGSWGTGKTTVIRYTELVLQESGYHSIYFDAWKNDFYSDPLLPIGSEILAALESNQTEDVKVDYGFQKFLNLSLRIGAEFALNKLSGGGVGMDDVKNALKDSEETPPNWIEEYHNQSEVNENISIALQKLLDLYKEENENRNLIVFIDELDRCKPSFTISILERIKHFFEVDGITFVLIFDKKQLEASIQHEYGPFFDGSLYLEKFFSVVVPLPEVTAGILVRSLMEDNQLESYLIQLEGILSKSYDYLFLYLTQLASLPNITPRKIQRIIFHLNVVLRTQIASGAYSAALIGLYVFIRELDFDFAKRIREDECTFSDIDTFFNRIGYGDLFNENNLGIYLETLMYDLDSARGKVPKLPFERLAELKESRRLDAINPEELSLLENMERIAAFAKSSSTTGIVYSLAETGKMIEFSLPESGNNV